MEIKVFNNNVEKALKVAKKKLAGEGLFRELKRRRYYEKPSVRRKRKALAARKKAKEFDTPYTPAHTLILALRAALRRIKDEGMEGIWERHRRMSEACQAGVSSMRSIRLPHASHCVSTGPVKLSASCSR